MRTVGLHLRITETLLDTVQRALQLGLKSFQCFLLHQDSSKRIRCSEKEIKTFTALRAHHFDRLYVHGSYWINLSGPRPETSEKKLIDELACAKRLSFTDYIVHPGSSRGWPDRADGLDSLVRILNSVLKQEKDINIILENTAHGGKTIGGDLSDFKTILEKIDFPDRLSFCIDTAHAYSFGYPIHRQHGKEGFIQLVDQTIGLERVAVIHLNDSSEPLACKHDRHAVLGDGNIGAPALKSFVLDKRVADVPLILELPIISDEQQGAIFDEVKLWHTKEMV